MNYNIARTRFLTLFAFVLTLAICGGTAQAEKFFFIGSADSDTIYFESHARLDYVEGFSHRLRGAITFNPDSVHQSNVEFLRVSGADVKLEVLLRDDPMPESHSDDDAHPFIEVALNSITGLPEVLPHDSPVPCEIQATFKIYGIVRPLQAPAEVWLHERDEHEGTRILEIKTEFRIVMDDYAIPRSNALFLTLTKRMNFHIHFVASSMFPVERF